jgi:hypothetical protein
VLSNILDTDQRAFPGRRLAQFHAGEVWAEKMDLDTYTCTFVLSIRIIAELTLQQKQTIWCIILLVSDFGYARQT